MGISNLILKSTKSATIYLEKIYLIQIPLSSCYYTHVGLTCTCTKNFNFNGMMTRTLSRRNRLGRTRNDHSTMNLDKSLTFLFHLDSDFFELSFFIVMIKTCPPKYPQQSIDLNLAYFHYSSLPACFNRMTNSFRKSILKKFFSLFLLLNNLIHTDKKFRKEFESKYF